MTKMEWKTLGDVCDFKRGTMITRASTQIGEVPVIAGGREPAYYHNSFNRKGETIAVAGSGVYSGFVSYWTVPVFLSDSFSVEPVDCLLPKYVFYFLKDRQDVIYNMKKGSGVPHVYPKDVAKLKIPLPPVEKQREIVDILDKFTSLTASLTAEKELRVKQYTYFRNKLLTFDAAENIASAASGQRPAASGQRAVRWVSLEGAFVIKNGYTPSKDNLSFWQDGIVPWFRMDDIRENGRILSDSIQHITPKAVKGGLFPKNSIIMATSATIGEHALITVPSLANQRFSYFSLKESYKDKINMRFFFYYCFLIGDWCRANVNAGNFASVDMPRLKKLKIPIPPLKEQERIAGILDKFDAYVNDIKQGLPAEVIARQKQYEYYHHKLLSFG